MFHSTGFESFWPQKLTTTLTINYLLFLGGNISWRYGYNQLTMQSLDNQWKKNVDIKQRKSFFVKNVIYIDVLILKIASYQTNRNISRCYFHFPPSNLIQINFKAQQKDRFYEHLLARFFSDITLQLSKKHTICGIVCFQYYIIKLKMNFKYMANLFYDFEWVVTNFSAVPKMQVSTEKQRREDIKSNFA